MRQSRLLAAVCAVAALYSAAALAQKKYDPGASDTEIKIGMTAPLSGPASAYGVACPVTEGFFQMINDKGGINGRKLKILCVDDGFSPPKAIEQTRKLVESDEVLVVYNSLGTAVNTAVQPYLVSKKVPQLLANTAASKWADPKANPWTTSSLPEYRTEAKIFAHYIMKNHPNAKVGLLYQNDDYGKDYLNGLKEGFGANAAKFIVAEQSYELSDPTIESQIIALKSKNVDVVVLGALAKHATQSIKKIGEMGWKPQIFLSWSSSGINSVLKVAGFEHATGLITTAVLKDTADPRWKDDKDLLAYKAFMEKYYPKGDVNNISNVFGYATCWLLMDILQRAGDNLTRENIMKLATNMDVSPPMYLPGVRFKITPTDYDPIKRYQMVRFDGTRFQSIGAPIGD